MATIYKTETHENFILIFVSFIKKIQSRTRWLRTWPNEGRHVTKEYSMLFAVI